MAKRSPSRRAATILEPVRTLPVAGKCDVFIAGGGIAGVAAAVAAARGGAAVWLAEKTCALGGLATLGHVTVWLPLCDGRGRQVIGGLGEELLKLSVADLSRDNPAAGFTRIPPAWRAGGDPRERRRTRYLARFNPASYLLALEKLVTDSGVRLLYDTRVCAVRRARGRITHLIVENKSGRTAVACRAAVDATGDADVCFLAGEPTESLDSNVLCGWFYLLQEDGLHLHAMTRSFSPRGSRDDAAGPFFRGDDAVQVTDHVLGSRQLICGKLAELRGQEPHKDIQVASVPTLPCLRMTRRLVGSCSLGEEDVHRWFDDACGLTGDWRQPGPVLALPWRCLCATRNRNLAAAGRCISVEPAVWDVTRAIPGCAVTGEAAGTAAALAARETGGDLRALPAGRLQTELRARGVLLDPNLVRPATGG